MSTADLLPPHRGPRPAMLSSGPLEAGTTRSGPALRVAWLESSGRVRLAAARDLEAPEVLRPGGALWPVYAERGLVLLCADAAHAAAPGLTVALASDTRLTIGRRLARYLDRRRPVTVVSDDELGVVALLDSRPVAQALASRAVLAARTLGWW